MYQENKRTRNQEIKKTSPFDSIRRYFMLTYVDGGGDIERTTFCTFSQLREYINRSRAEGCQNPEIYAALLDRTLTGACCTIYRKDGGKLMASRLDKTDTLRWHQLIAWGEYCTGTELKAVELSFYPTLLEQCLMAKVTRDGVAIKRHIINSFEELQRLCGEPMRVTLNQWAQVLDTRTSAEALAYIAGSYSMRATETGKMFCVAKGQRVVSEWHKVGRVSPFLFHGREAWRPTFTNHETGEVTQNFLARIDAGNGWELILSYPTPEQMNNPFYTYSL